MQARRWVQTSRAAGVRCWIGLRAGEFCQPYSSIEYRGARCAARLLTGSYHRRGSRAPIHAVLAVFADPDPAQLSKYTLRPIPGPGAWPDGWLGALGARFAVVPCVLTSPVRAGRLPVRRTSGAAGAPRRRVEGLQAVLDRLVQFAGRRGAVLSGQDHPPDAGNADCGHRGSQPSRPGLQPPTMSWLADCAPFCG